MLLVTQCSLWYQKHEQSSVSAISSVSEAMQQKLPSSHDGQQQVPCPCFEVCGFASPDIGG